MAAVRAAATCYSSAAGAMLRRPSLVAFVALPSARGVDDERRLVGMNTSALSAFVGARGAVGATLRT
jgi:hypothetical protein